VPAASSSVTPSHTPSPSKPSAPKCGSLIKGQTCTSYSQCSSCTCSLGKCA
jgi:hypothetical protein